MDTDPAGCRQLAAAVIRCALQDAVNPCAPTADRERARVFLTTRCTGLVFWAAVAGLDADAVIAQVRRVMRAARAERSS